MKFLVDAQLSRRLARLLAAAQHDAIHTLDLPRGNRTSDTELCEVCAREDRVLVTKDSDFTSSFFTKREPPRMLLVSTGNITNRELEVLFRTHLAAIVQAFDTATFLEIDRGGISVRA